MNLVNFHGDFEKGDVKNMKEEKKLAHTEEGEKKEEKKLVKTGEEKIESTSPIKLLIIGGTGSLGSFLIKKYYNTVVDGKRYKLYIISRDENKQWELKMKYPDINFLLGDMRDYNSMVNKIKSITPNIIIIAAALKHIDSCEVNIDQTLKTNVDGIQNVINAVLDIYNPAYSTNIKEKLSTVLFVSTDKACSPVNVYGMSKAIGERITIDASTKNKEIKFLCVRYGNVLNSRGSILPKFRDIGISRNLDNYFPVTHDKMTRFFMRLEDSVELIHNSILYANSGETIIPILNAFKIYELAELFSSIYNRPIKIVGIRQGEKLDECLINIEESFRTEKRKMGNKEYYVIHPMYKPYLQERILDKEYTSNKTMTVSKELIEDFI